MFLLRKKRNVIRGMRNPELSLRNREIKKRNLNENNFQFKSQVKYSKQDLSETKEERKQRKYRYLYQVTAF